VRVFPRRTPTPVGIGLIKRLDSVQLEVIKSADLRSPVRFRRVASGFLEHDHVGSGPAKLVRVRQSPQRLDGGLVTSSI